MRRLLLILVTLVLGAGSAVLVACGDSGTEGGLPQGSADQLASDFEDIRERVDSAQCSELEDQLRQINSRLDNLPRDVDAGLVERLRQAQQRLAGLARAECNENRVNTDTQTTETEEPPPTTEPPPTAVPTQTTEPPPTTDTAPEPPTTEPADPTAPDPGLPPLDDDTVPPDEGGGTSPEVE